MTKKRRALVGAALLLVAFLVVRSQLDRGVEYNKYICKGEVQTEIITYPCLKPPTPTRPYSYQACWAMRAERDDSRPHDEGTRRYWDEKLEAAGCSK